MTQCESQYIFESIFSKNIHVHVSFSSALRHDEFKQL